MPPIILSTEVDDGDYFESEYRVKIGTQVKYLTIAPNRFDRQTLSCPIQALSSLSWEDEWTVAHISRPEPRGELKTSLSNKALAGVKHHWHHAMIDCLELVKSKQLTAMVLEARYTHFPNNVIAKIARFEWEIPRIERETLAYQLLQDSSLTPRFLGHIHESGRIMGFILEKLEGCAASIENMEACETVLKRLHQIGLLHGDTNRHNFLVIENGVKLLDFERFRENASPEAMQQEMDSLRVELMDDSGRGGGGFIFQDG